MYRVSKQNQGILIIIYILVGLTFMFSMPNNLDVGMSRNYGVVLGSYFIVFGTWICYICKYGFYIFEPSTMVVFLTGFTFSIEPMISINMDDILLAGFSVFDGCIKATIIYTFAIELFMFLYYHHFSIGTKNNVFQLNDENFYSEDLEIREPPDSKQMIVVYFFAILGTIVLLYDTLQSGYSLQYIFSWGSQGEAVDSESPLGALINLRYFIAPAYIYLDEYDKRKWPVAVMRVIAIFSLLVRTTRWFLIVLILSPIVYKYVKSKEKIPFVKLTLVCTIVALIIGVMQFTRGYVRDGAGITGADWSSFSWMSIWGAFSGNFDLYKTLYGAVVYFPASHFYTLGQQMIYVTLVTCIPRAIWPGKPVSIIDNELKQYFMGAGAVRGHWAYAQLTEFYIEFGVLGVLVIFGLFANWCKHLKKLYTVPRDIHDIIYYSLMFPFLFQLVIRGYMPINFWAFIFMVIPILIIKGVDTRGQTCEGDNQN